MSRWLAPAFWGGGWTAAACFLIGDLQMVAGRDDSGARWIAYLGHVAAAVPLLAIAPLQFVTAIRLGRPAMHRWLGRVFLATAMLSGLLAVFLGATMASEGTQMPLMLFGLLWACFAGVAWLAAWRGDYATHRRFVWRVIALASSFVVLHLMQMWETELFGFLESGELRYATRGWLSLVLPLLAVEAWLGWAPPIWGLFRRADKREMGETTRG